MYSRNNVRRNSRKAGSLSGLVLAGCLLVSGGSAFALPPEHEIQRLMLAVEESVQEQQWEQAADYLNRLQRLEGEKPPEYLFYRGQVMAHSRHYNEALSALENYVAGTGADGEHYTEALKLITDIERNRTNQAGGNEANNEEQVAEIVLASEDGENGQAGSGEAASTSALVARLNRLLDRAGWRRDARIIREGSTPDVHYQVSVGNGEIQFRESHQDEQGTRKLSTLTLPVYGVSPTVEWSCETATEACWIYDPRDESRFLKLGNDRDRAGAVASTLGKLIRRLQRPSEED